jgi:heat shock protein HslJ
VKVNRHDRLTLLVLSTGLVLLAACRPAVTPAPDATIIEPQAAATPQASVALEGTEWTLAALHGGDPVAGSSLTLAFYEDNYIEGTAGCNSYGVDYTISGQAFHIAEIHRTDFECEDPPGIMPQEEAFFEALASVAAYRATGDRLEFDNAAGEAILVYTRRLPPVVDPALKDTEWLLTSLLGDSLLEGSRITLNLGGEGFEGFAGCNNYGGEYEAADGGALRFGFFPVTAMACPSPEGIMEQEQAYIDALTQASTYRLDGNRLEIRGAAGETILVYARKEEFATDPGDLLGTVWRLVSLDGERVGDGSAFTLTFYSQSILGGQAGCRDYLSTYQAAGDDLNLLSEAVFDANCQVGTTGLEQEGEFLGILAPKADLRLAGGQLEIYGERGGVLVFEPLPEEANLDLEGPVWSLLAFVGPNTYVEEPEPWPMPDGLLLGTTIDLTFEGDNARGSAGCNSYGAAYSRSGSSMSLENVTFTEMACLEPQGIMEQEARYLELVAAVIQYRIYGDRLWLETDDGRALVLFAGGVR